jgi:hypothetical protein
MMFMLGPPSQYLPVPPVPMSRKLLLRAHFSF